MFHCDDVINDDVIVVGLWYKLCELYVRCRQSVVV